MTSGRNCFGSSLRDIGHRRLPEPPQRMTGTRGESIALTAPSAPVLTSAEPSQDSNLPFDNPIRDHVARAGQRVAANFRGGGRCPDPRLGLDQCNRSVHSP